jgi:hypothetical protein
MKNLMRFGGVAAAFCVLTFSQVPDIALAEGASAADAGWAKMTRCAAIGDDKARHTCTDDALREAGLLTDETKAAAKRQAFGLQKPATSAVAAAAAPPQMAAQPASSPGREESDRLEVTLANVTKSGDGKLTLTTTEGAVWHQVESEAVSQVPRQGEVMKIETRSLGGFMCRPSKYVSFRCYRIK